MTIIQSIHKILHGGDYNPDQWLDEPGIIDEDFKLMDKAFCNTFSVGIFSWGQIEIEEGKFDFAWLDDIFERAAKSGKKLLLATPSAARPGWLAEKYPETNISDHTGFRIPEDISVTGYANMKQAYVTVPAITTVEQQPYEQGRMVGELLLKLIYRQEIPNRHIRVKPNLQINQSCTVPRDRKINRRK